MLKIVRSAVLGIIVLVTLMSCAVAASASALKPPAEEMVSGLIVKPRDQAGAKLAGALQTFDARALAQTAKVAMKVVRPMSGGAHVIKLEQPVTLSEARVIAERLMRNNQDVELVEPDRIMQPTATTPADPGYILYQWHYFAPSGANKGGANLPNAWDISRGNAAITVAVIDTGYRPHIDFATAILPGYDFIADATRANDGNGRDADAQDPGDWVALNECNPANGSPADNSSWHGTHVAGTVAAAMNNGAGGTGVAPNVRILPVRVLGKCGGLTSDVVDGMRWAAGLAVPGVPINPNRAQVLNMSLGGSGSCSSTYQSAVNDIVNAGKVIVAATGNESSAVGTPANCTGVIAVTAHAVDGDNAWYANAGTAVTLSAPGGGCGSMTACTDFSSANGLGIYSLTNTGTTTPVADSYSANPWAGTSMATPHVAGVIALMLSVKSSLTPAQIKSYLRSSTRAHPAGSWCTTSSGTGLCGAGLLDATGALNTTIAAPPVVALTNPSQIVAPNSVVTLVGSATANSPRTITSYRWTQITGAAVVMNNANTTRATFTSPATGIYSFRLTATDSTGETGTAEATVRVNSAPVLSTVADQTVTVGNALNFTVSATDVDGGTPLFHSVSLPSGATLSAQGVFNWPNAIPVGNYTMTYYASDSDSANSTQGSVNITVTDTPPAPPPPAPTGGGGGGGGGCSIKLKQETPDPVLPIMMVAAGWHLLRRRSKPGSTILYQACGIPR